ncbi:MAG: hypothetical protein PHI23_01125 [Candidatus Peribacteraceae bacterium]|nr:hypothetical protein [Candidatus Peribacteraceae bacterium]
MANTNPPVLPVPPPSKSGEEIYDAIMREIEPELVTDQLPLLKEKYKEETPEQKNERGARYQKAFEEYDRRYKLYLSAQHEKVRQFKKSALGFVEAHTNQDDAAKMQSLESSFSKP